MSMNGDPLRLAVFDCDGTIVDSQASIIGCMREAWSAEGLPHPEDEAVRRVVGLSLPVAIANLAPQEGPERHARLTDLYRQAFRERRSRAGLEEPLYPGFLEALDALEAAGFLLGIATGKGRPGLEDTLGRHGLTGRFVTLQTSDRAAGKPHPEMLYNAMAEAGVEKSRTVMIGDTSFDMAMAVNAGCAGVGVTWGYHGPDDLREAGAHQIIDHYDMLLDIACNLTAR